MFKKILDNKKITIIIAVIVIISVSLVIILCKKEDNSTEIIDSFTEEEKANVQEVPQETKKLVIHITGCVQNIGIVEVAEGSRIVDVIEKAGGITNEADISKVNLAYIVKDAQKIYIPSIYDVEITEYISTENGENVIVDDNIGGKKSMININTSTQTELEQLPGIGPSTALKIINYREENGKFKSIEDIKNVQGIGDSKYNNIKDMIEI